MVLVDEETDNEGALYYLPQNHLTFAGGVVSGDIIIMVFEGIMRIYFFVIVCFSCILAYCHTPRALECQFRILKSISRISRNACMIFRRKTLTLYRIRGYF